MIEQFGTRRPIFVYNMDGLTSMDIPKRDYEKYYNNPDDEGDLYLASKTVLPQLRTGIPEYFDGTKIILDPSVSEMYNDDLIEKIKTTYNLGQQALDWLRGEFLKNQPAYMKYEAIRKAFNEKKLEIGNVFDKFVKESLPVDLMDYQMKIMVSDENPDKIYPVYGSLAIEYMQLNSLLDGSLKDLLKKEAVLDRKTKQHLIANLKLCKRSLNRDKQDQKAFIECLLRVLNDIEEGDKNIKGNQFDNILRTYLTKILEEHLDDDEDVLPPPKPRTATLFEVDR